MTTYTPTVWADEVPATTPVKYAITDDTAGEVAASATITPVTTITPGTAYNAVAMNKIENGIKNAQDDANTAQAAAVAAQADADKGVYMYDRRNTTIEIPLNDDTALTTSKKGYGHVPELFAGGTFIGVRVNAHGPSSSGDIEVSIKKNGVSVMTTNPLIEEGETSTLTSAQPGVIDETKASLADNDEFEVGVVQAGTGATYVNVSLLFAPPAMT